MKQISKIQISRTKFQEPFGCWSFFLEFGSWVLGNLVLALLFFIPPLEQLRFAELAQVDLAFQLAFHEF